MNRLNFSFILIIAILITACSEDSIVTPSLEMRSDTDRIEWDSINDKKDQSNAILLHSKLMDSFSCPSRSTDNPESTNLLYPDFYGGCYINEQNNLVILLTDTSKYTYFENILNTNDIKFEKCSYPLSILEDTQNEICSYLNQNPTSDLVKNCTSIYLSDRENLIVVRFKKNAPQLESLLKSTIINSDMVRFEYIEGEEFILTSATSINAGSACSAILSSTDQGNSSVGYKVKTSDGKIGFIGSAHSIPRNTKVYVGNKACAISSNTKWQFSGSIDATFCEVTDTTIFMPSNKIEGTKYTLSGKLSLPGAGTIVHKRGAVTLSTYGTVESTNAAAIINGVTFTNLTSVKNMNCEEGDSGGIVYSIVTSTNTVYTLGIVSGKGLKSGETYFTKAPLINSAFNVSLCK